jgi:hypothetical protein
MHDCLSNMTRTEAKELRNTAIKQVLAIIESRMLNKTAENWSLWEGKISELQKT